eukprot:12407698-Karenia_brevis.AAC.1
MVDPGAGAFSPKERDAMDAVGSTGASGGASKGSHGYSAAGMDMGARDGESMDDLFSDGGVSERLKDRSDQFKPKGMDSREKRRVQFDQEHRRELSEKVQKIRQMTASPL